ncbi:MAG TPA: cytochrome o ubiquinol oxidase subunit IV [Allosphingosinicella sp.]|nr:cytochrome o ubiquinol oxidase subunit IV [Allosphingosinicella sp.]
MSDPPEMPPMDAHDVAPGDEDVNLHELAGGLRGYLIGLALAVGLTIASFTLGAAHWLWAPSIPAALIVLAIAQMGVHLAFFLHIGTGPDNTNNVLALAFGILIVALILFGSIWIMAHLNHHNMVPTAQMMRGMP